MTLQSISHHHSCFSLFSFSLSFLANCYLVTITDDEWCLYTRLVAPCKLTWQRPSTRSIGAQHHWEVVRNDWTKKTEPSCRGRERIKETRVYDVKFLFNVKYRLGFIALISLVSLACINDINNFSTSSHSVNSLMRDLFSFHQADFYFSFLSFFFFALSLSLSPSNIQGQWMIFILSFSLTKQ